MSKFTKFEEVLFTNDSYQVGTFLPQEDDPILCYGVVNTRTGVMEEEGYDLPRLLIFASQGNSILLQILPSNEPDELAGLNLEEVQH